MRILNRWSRLLFALVFVCLIAVPPASAGSDAWTTTSLLHYNVQTLAIDPKDTDTVFAGTHQGLLVSRDAGETWSSVPIMSRNISSVAIDPQNGETIYAVGDNQLQKTNNGGQNWRVLGDGVLQRPFHIAVHPQKPLLLYVHTNAGLFRSPAFVCT